MDGVKIDKVMVKSLKIVFSCSLSIEIVLKFKL
jgi:hypothetical protein